MNRESLKHLRAGGRVGFADGVETLLPPAPTGPSIEDLIEQGYLLPTGRRRPSVAMRFGELLNSAFSKAREAQGPVDMAAFRPFAANRRCNNLKGIYGADMYAPAAVQVLRTENATLRRRVKAYAAVALLGWIAVVVMGVVL